MTTRNSPARNGESNRWRTIASSITPRIAGRHGRGDDHPQQPPRLPHLAAIRRDPEEAAQQVEPVAPEIEEESRRRADVEDHDERQERRRLLVHRPAQDRRQDDRMAEAADRKQLGDPLQDRQGIGVEIAHRSGAAVLAIDVDTPALYAIAAIARKQPRPESAGLREPSMDRADFPAASSPGLTRLSPRPPPSRSPGHPGYDRRSLAATVLLDPRP